MTLRDKMAEKTKGLKRTEEFSANAESARRAVGFVTAPGMHAALLDANEKLAKYESNGTLSVIAITHIEPNPKQPRKVFDEEEIQSLAESIETTGLIQPVVLRPHPTKSGFYQLVAGERRLRAHKLLGKLDISASINTVSDADLGLMALAENLSREALTDYEISQSLKDIEPEFASRKKFAAALGMSRSGLYRYLAFETLPGFIQQSLNEAPGLMSAATADKLSTLLSREGDNALKITEALWPNVVSGLIEQAKFCAAIEAELNTRPLPKRRIANTSQKLFVGRSYVGSIVKDEQVFTLRLKNEALTDELEDKIRKFLVELFPRK